MIAILNFETIRSFATTSPQIVKNENECSREIVSTQSSKALGNI